VRRLSRRDRVLPFPLAEKLGLAATSVQPVFYGARRFTPRRRLRRKGCWPPPTSAPPEHVSIEPIILASIEFAADSTRVQPAVIKPAMRPRALPAGFIAPCLPTSAPQAPSGAALAARNQARWFRVIARKAGERVKLYSRPGNDLTYRFPLIVEALAKLRSRSCIIDGEAVACGMTGSHLLTSSYIGIMTRTCSCGPSI
jgi:hypothetical protein